MARSELVEKYQQLVEKYDLLQQRITKVREQKGQFKNNVVERVLSDYEEQLKELERQLLLLEEEVYPLVAELETERHRVGAEKSSLDERRDEIDLRNLIGEFADGEYEARSEELALELADVNIRLEAHDEQLASYRELLERAGADKRRSAPPSTPRPVISSPASGASPQAGELNGQGQAFPSNIPAQAAPPSEIFTTAASTPLDDANATWGVRPTAASAGVAPSLGSHVGFGDFGAAPVSAELERGNAFEMILDDFPVSSDADLGKGLSALGNGAMDELHGLTELDNQWQKGLGDDFPPASNFDGMLGQAGGGVLDDGFDGQGFGTPPDDFAALNRQPGAEARGRAFLIRHFNRPDEDRYEIRDDVTSIGRGRDNQIQIKDDTKVSRYHCRILREPAGFYVEDNNSSNGTMVNGELITRRKVEGGEDVTIGETLFRFQMT